MVTQAEQQPGQRGLTSEFMVVNESMIFNEAQADSFSQKRDTFRNSHQKPTALLIAEVFAAPENARTQTMRIL